MGVVSSSIGGVGSDACPDDDDRAHLLNRGGAMAMPIADEGTSSFLAWLPMVNANTGKPTPAGRAAALGDVNQFKTDFTNLVVGVGDHGCDFPAQLESWYRFLVQPDPYDHIEVNGGRASFVGIDATILQERHDFLRPDSLVAVIVVTGENEKTVDPMALGGQGWVFLNSTLPAGVIAPTPDALSLRTFHMKERFGVDVEFPIARYVRGLTQPNVPDRDHEHYGGAPMYTGECDGTDPDNCPANARLPNANCTNPLFAASLPVDPSGDLCHLRQGLRDPSLVFYAIIGGVPHQLLQASPGSADCLSGTNPADCPEKSILSDADWKTVLGADPHMIESITPRAGIPGPGAADDADPIVGRDWDTHDQDLQYACTFNLNLTPPKDCSLPQYAGACDCENGYDGPLCQSLGSTIQIKGKAYPTIRELEVARAVGDQGIVSSLCPIHETDDAAGTDPLFGFRPAMNAIIDRLKTTLDGQCLEPALPVHADGTVDCLILETLAYGDQSACDDASRGFSQPAPDVLAAFKKAERAADPTGSTAKLPTCEVKQLVGGDLVNGACDQSTAAGFCYVTGAAAGACPRAILFSPTGNPQVGSTVSFQCGC
jgi:hypothetical protein